LSDRTWDRLWNQDVKTGQEPEGTEKPDQIRGLHSPPRFQSFYCSLRNTGLFGQFRLREVSIQSKPFYPLAYLIEYDLIAIILVNPHNTSIMANNQ
jgi:hypothetical protein